jgi:hypothetical protein
MRTKLNFDSPIITPDLDQDQILELFANNEQFAMLWFRQIATGHRGLNMPIEQHRKITAALRDYITMLDMMLAGTELLLEQVETAI